MPSFFKAFLVLCVLWCFGTGGHVYAQTSLPGSADPGRFEERFKSVIIPEKLEASPLPRSSINTPIPDAIDGFVLNGITFAGVTAFEDSVLEAITNNYIGRSVDLNSLNHLAARLTQFYHSEGYFLTYSLIQPQEIKGGIVEVSIIEGGVNDVIFDDPDNVLGRDLFGISNKIKDKIQNMSPLHGPTLERYMLLLNKGRRASIKSILSSAPNSHIPSAVNVTLKVEKISNHVVLNYNNHGSRFVGPHQIDASYNAGGLLSPHDNFTLQSVFSIPIREVQFGSLSYDLPINDNGLRLSTSASYANSEPGLSLRDLEVESDSTFFEIGLTHPIITSRRTNLNIGANLEMSHSSIEFLDEELIDDKLRIFSINTDFNTLDRWDGSNNIHAQISKGLNILSATETGSDNLSRTQGRSDFVKIEGSFARSQPLSNYLNLSTTLLGQYSPHPLFSSEEFGYGGADMGRAYNASEITGDQGIAAGVELMYTPARLANDALTLAPFAFYDIGKVWNLDTGSKPLSAASAGIGVHWALKEMVSGTVQMAWPLTKTVDSPVTGGRDGPRILFSLKTSF